jgi:hypothetical protein
MQIRGETPQYTGIGDWVVSKGKEVAPNLAELAKVVPAVLPTPTETAAVRVPAKTERIATAIDVRVGEVCFKGPKARKSVSLQQEMTKHKHGWSLRPDLKHWDVPRKLRL